MSNKISPQQVFSICCYLQPRLADIFADGSQTLESLCASINSHFPTLNPPCKPSNLKTILKNMCALEKFNSTRTKAPKPTLWSRLAGEINGLKEDNAWLSKRIETAFSQIALLESRISMLEQATQKPTIGRSDTSP